MVIVRVRIIIQADCPPTTIAEEGLTLFSISFLKDKSLIQNLCLML